MENIGCWGRIYHAPDKIGGYGNAAQNGQTYYLEGPPGWLNPIKVGVGSTQGLPPNAIGNITQYGHMFHNSQMADWPTCPQVVPQQGRGNPPAACNQVYREPYLENGEIRMYTRGTGENNADWLNEWQGPRVFKRLDDMMKEAIGNTTNQICPSP